MVSSLRRLSGQRRWRRAALVVVGLAAAALATRVLYDSSDELLTAADTLTSVQPAWVLVAVLAELVSYLARGGATAVVLRHAGGGAGPIVLTVATLAGVTGVSRAALARRFTELVGEPPMTYLTSWRLALAADLLRDTNATIGTIARRVGYGSPFALSSAFKRVRGISPQQYRKSPSRKVSE